MKRDGFESQPLDQAAGHYELTLKGRVYADSAPTLKAEVMELADGGLKQLIVDATDLEQIDSSGLNVFVHLLKRIRPEGGGIVFFGLNANLARVFDITKLGKVMGIKTTRDEALESIAQ